MKVTAGFELESLHRSSIQERLTQTLEEEDESPENKPSRDGSGCTERGNVGRVTRTTAG
jgi:hypothetical protein